MYCKAFSIQEPDLFKFICYPHRSSREGGGDVRMLEERSYMERKKQRFLSKFICTRRRMLFDYVLVEEESFSNQLHISQIQRLLTRLSNSNHFVHSRDQV